MSFIYVKILSLPGLNYLKKDFTVETGIVLIP